MSGSIFAELLECIFPTKCAVCATLTGKREQDAFLCNECRETLYHKTEEKCRRCHMPVCDCTCITDSLKEDGFIMQARLFYYKSTQSGSPQNRFIYAMKESSDPRIYKFIAHALAEKVRDRIDETVNLYGLTPIITYVPRSTVSKRKYGNDQAELLAKALSRELGIPVFGTAARKKLSSPEMKTLSREERRRASRDIYVPLKNAPIDKKTFLIITDDIITTGSSVLSVSSCARTAGVRFFGAISAGETY